MLVIPFIPGVLDLKRPACSISPTIIFPDQAHLIDAVFPVSMTWTFSLTGAVVSKMPAEITVGYGGVVELDGIAVNGVFKGNFRLGGGVFVDVATIAPGPNDAVAAITDGS